MLAVRLRPSLFLLSSQPRLLFLIGEGARVMALAPTDEHESGRRPRLKQLKGALPATAVLTLNAHDLGTCMGHEGWLAPEVN